MNDEIEDFISDDEFAKLVTKIHHDREIPLSIESVAGKLNSHQIYTLCQLGIRYGVCSQILYGDCKLPISAEHVDFFMNSGYHYAMEIMFSGPYPVTQEHISIGLNSEEYAVRIEAYHHENCTEAQKVAYLLKWGQDDGG